MFEILIGLGGIILVISLAQAKTQSNIWENKYLHEVKSADSWRNIALKLQKEIK